jgi:hypothetical protein
MSSRFWGANQSGLRYPLGASFNPVSLFAGGGLGTWYDPSDLASMWQDSGGTTPAAVDSPVGKLNDKSGNGNHMLQGTASKRPILRNSGGLYWLEFDGTDDFMSCGSFTHADASGFSAQVAGAAFTDTSGAEQVLMASGGSVRRDFRKNNATLEAIAFNTVPSAFTDSGPTFTAGEAMVMTATLGAGGALEIKKNRTGAGGATTVTGTLQVGSTITCYIGANGGTSEFLSGKFYGGFWIPRSPTSSEIANMEAWSAGKAGVAL